MITVYDEYDSGVNGARDELGFDPDEHNVGDVDVLDDMTYDDAIRRATRRVIASLARRRQEGGALPPPAAAVAMMLRATNDALKPPAKTKGSKSDKGGRPPARSLTQVRPRQAAELVMLYRHVVLIPAVETDPKRAKALLAVYDEADGLYRECAGENNELTVFLQEAVYDSSTNFMKETTAALRDLAPLHHLTTDPDLVALDDCVYRMSTKERLPYSPDMVFMAKARTRLPEVEPELPRIQNPDGSWWDPESWMLETMGPPALVRQIHEVNNRLLRPRAFTDDKMIGYYSESGSNGKGTILAQQRYMLGGPKGIGCTSFGLQDFSGDKEFILEPMIDAVANLADESESGTYLKSAALIKAITSHDPITINRKYSSVVSVRIFAPMIFSLNAVPRFKEKSPALERRFHIIPFNNRFMGDGTTAIKKNPAIKHDYLLRDEVREWFVWQALCVVGEITEMSTPEEVANMLVDFREENNPVTDFWKVFGPDITAIPDMEAFPLEAAYDIYWAWSRQSRGSGAKVESYRSFSDALIKEVEAEGVWREERGGRDRVRRSLKTWSADHGRHLAEVVGHFGYATTEQGSDAKTREVITGEPRVARWTLTKSLIGVIRHPRAMPAALRGPCLVRDVAPSAPAKGLSWVYGVQDRSAFDLVEAQLDATQLPLQILEEAANA